MKNCTNCTNAKFRCYKFYKICAYYTREFFPEFHSPELGVRVVYKLLR